VRGAAARHAISQPALTKPILRLEDEVGVVLLNAPGAWRDARAYGRTLLRHRPYLQASLLLRCGSWRQRISFSISRADAAMERKPA